MSDHQAPRDAVLFLISQLPGFIARIPKIPRSYKMESVEGIAIKKLLPQGAIY